MAAGHGPGKGTSKAHIPERTIRCPFYYAYPLNGKDGVSLIFQFYIYQNRCRIWDCK